MFAYQDQDFTKLMYTGSEEVFFEGRNAVETVSVKMDPLSTSGKYGTLVIPKLNPETNVTEAISQLNTVCKSGTTTDLWTTDSDTSLVLECGTYNVTIELTYDYEDKTIIAASESIAVSIYENITTTIGGTVDDEQVHVKVDAEGPYTVMFDTNGISSIASLQVKVGETVNRPTVLGCVVKGFYKDKDFQNEWNFDSDVVTTNTTIYADLVDAIHLEPIYSDPDDVTKGITGMKKVRPNAQVEMINTSSTNVINLGSTGKDSWYILSGNISTRTISCFGNVHLILQDSCDINTTGTYDDLGAGIRVVSGNSLTIYSQSFGSEMGKLTSAGIINRWGFCGAGIGAVGSSGKITINGGMINASGTTYSNGSAGIGSGFFNNASADDIVINGGEIVATGGYGAAGIGGGSTSNPSSRKKIVINGGLITATGGSNGEGIGSGHKGKASDVIVSSNLNVKVSSSQITSQTEAIVNTGSDLSSYTERYWSIF